MPVARTMVSLPAGMVQMNQLKFLIWTAAGSTIWIAALAGAGNWFGKQFANLDAFVGPLALVAIGSLVALYIYRVITWKVSDERRGGKECVSTGCTSWYP